MYFVYLLNVLWLYGGDGRVAVAVFKFVASLLNFRIASKADAVLVSWPFQLGATSPPIVVGKSH